MPIVSKDVTETQYRTCLVLLVIQRTSRFQWYHLYSTHTGYLYRVSEVPTARIPLHHICWYNPYYSFMNRGSENIFKARWLLGSRFCHNIAAGTLIAHYWSYSSILSILRCAGSFRKRDWPTQSSHWALAPGTVFKNPSKVSKSKIIWALISQVLFVVSVFGNETA